MDKDLYDLPPEELKKIPTVCGSLREALGNLDKDRAFLKAGGVFNDDLIDAYIELKMEDVHALRDDAAPGRVRRCTTRSDFSDCSLRNRKPRGKLRGFLLEACPGL